MSVSGGGTVAADTPDVARRRAIVGGMKTHSILTGTPYIGVAEIAERAGIRESSVRSQMRAMRQRKFNPVDMRVPSREMPAGIGRGQALYWRADVEEWFAGRAARAAGKGRL